MQQSRAKLGENFGLSFPNFIVDTPPPSVAIVLSRDCTNKTRSAFNRDIAMSAMDENFDVSGLSAFLERLSLASDEDRPRLLEEVSPIIDRGVQSSSFRVSSFRRCRIVIESASDGSLTMLVFV